MVRIAPVRLSFNPKTLWFDAGELELHPGDAVVVSTVRGEEFGHISDTLFEMDDEEAGQLKNPLKPVKRLATESDIHREEEVEELSKLALPIFKSMAFEIVPDMHPVAVEYLFDADKAIFYFESEDRVDFRELVRRLASEFHVRIDMKQIGVRDGARIIGGIGHCGQEICCRRLGGEFHPVSIRMAKEQDLSLNPQKISGLCGRLMCCLRYENEAYKDFHSRAPKKGASIETPDGIGKVVDMDVPQEVISIKVEDEKPIKVPLADMEVPPGGGRPDAVGEKAWERACEPAPAAMGMIHLFGTSELSGEDKLAEPRTIRHANDEEGKSKAQGTRKRRNTVKSDAASSKKQGDGNRKSRRRRSTTVNAEGVSKTEKSSSGNKNRSHNPGKQDQSVKKTTQVGRNSSGLRANRGVSQNGNGKGSGQTSSKGDTGSQSQRRRRRSHKA